MQFLRVSPAAGEPRMRRPVAGTIWTLPTKKPRPSAAHTPLRDRPSEPRAGCRAPAGKTPTPSLAGRAAASRDLQAFEACTHLQDDLMRVSQGTFTSSRLAA